jgi:hypothetical protein
MATLIIFFVIYLLLLSWNFTLWRRLRRARTEIAELTARAAVDPATIPGAVASAMHAVMEALGPVREAAAGERLRLMEAGFGEDLAENMAARLYDHAMRSLRLDVDVHLASGGMDEPQ